MLTRSLLAGASLFAMASAAYAGPLTFTESLTSASPLPGSVTTPIILNGVGIIPPSQTTITTPSYTVSFTEPVSQGVVNGTFVNLHAVPVGGVSATLGTEYLSGDFGSALTPNVARSGNYFSTDAGANKITITFAAPQTSLAFLAGSIDTQNLITLSGGSVVGSDTLTGTQLQAVPGFSGNGAQGFGGSAYVTITDATPFTTVTLSSGVISFEVAGLAGSNTPFAVPEPMSLALLGSGLAVMGVVRRRTRR